MRAETQYFLRRASEEAHQAIRSDNPQAADAHQGLSNRYSAKAVTLLVEEDEPAMPCSSRS